MLALLLATFFAVGAAAQSLPASGGAAASGAVPNLIKYSNVLKDGSGAVITALSGVTFLIYKDEQGGAPLWMETQNVQPDKAGRYTVQLGAVSKVGLPAEVFMTGEARWLAVQVGGVTEQARVALVAVPYAMKAADAQTLGGLPASAFVLAALPNASPATATTGSEVSGSTAAPGSLNVTTTGGTANTIPLFTTATNIQNSILTQTGTAAVNVGGMLNLPATGTATSSKGFNSQPGDFVASVFNSGTSTPVLQTFQWQAEPVNNDTTTASGTLNLLFGQGTSVPTETGFKISNKGVLSFATGQTFPGTGTVRSVNSGPGLTGGPITTTGTLRIANAGVTNTMLANPALTVNAGTDLVGGGVVSLGGSTTLNLDTTKVPRLNTANTFTGNQTVNGNLSATGLVTGSAFNIGSALFAFGSSAFANAFLGFAGNTTMTGGGNTASGKAALLENTTGSSNTASGGSALLANTTGFNNTASGVSALLANTSGNDNTAVGVNAGNAVDSSPITGSNNTAIGAFASFGTGSLTNATAVGANAEVDASNSLVLGSINRVNGATVDTFVGIGITRPGYKLHVGSINNSFRVEGPPQGGNFAVAASFGGHGDFGIDAPGIPEGRFVVKDTSGFVGIGLSAPDALLSVNGVADKPGGGSWDTFSDRRLKTLNGNFTSGLEQILKLKPVRYRYKDDNALGIHDPQEHVGLVAQEVQRVIPEAVTENSKGYLLVNNDPILWAMLNAIKEQQGQIREQKEQIRKQQEQIRAQQAQIVRLSSQIKVIQTSLSGNGRTSSEIRPVKATVSVAKQ